MNPAGRATTFWEFIMNVYEDNGYEDREDYLRAIAEDSGVDIGIVFAMAELLGPNEDFDGLVTSMEVHNAL